MSEFALNLVKLLNLREKKRILSWKKDILERVKDPKKKVDWSWLGLEPDPKEELSFLERERDNLLGFEENLEVLVEKRKRILWSLEFLRSQVIRLLKLSNYFSETLRGHIKVLIEKYNLPEFILLSFNKGDCLDVHYKIHEAKKEKNFELTESNLKKRVRTLEKELLKSIKEKDLLPNPEEKEIIKKINENEDLNTDNIFRQISSFNLKFQNKWNASILGKKSRLDNFIFFLLVVLIFLERESKLDKMLGKRKELYKKFLNNAEDSGLLLFNSLLKWEKLILKKKEKIIERGEEFLLKIMENDKDEMKRRKNK